MKGPPLPAPGPATREAAAPIAFALSALREAARQRPDAVAAFAGGWVRVGCRATGVPDEAAVRAAAEAAGASRGVASAAGFRLPERTAGD